MQIKKALNYLNKNYLLDPETVFPLILILNSLNVDQSDLTKRLKTKIVTTLRKEMNSDKTFNYWFKNHQKYTIEPYPNDLDDIFCAWAALFSYNKFLVDQDVLLALSQVLLINQQKISGPYFTWHLDHLKNPKWNELDLVVNLNIARFLAKQNVYPSGLIEYIEQRINSNDLSSIYYKDELSSIYFLSLFYTGSFKCKLKEKIITYLQNNIQDNSIILLYIAILRFGFFDLLKKSDLDKIFALQNKDGSFDEFDFYKYRNKLDGRSFYSNKALSTAFLLEFLFLFQDYQQYLKNYFLKNRVISVFKKRIKTLRDEIVEQLLIEKALIVLDGKHSDFAIFMPQRFIEDLNQKLFVSKKILENLFLINLFAWIAYTIYDQINDERKEIQELPIANLAWQFLIRELILLPNSSKYLVKLISYFLEMEKNSLREFEYFRFKGEPWSKISMISKSQLMDFSYKKSIGQVFAVDFLLDYFKLADHKIILKILVNMLLIKQMIDDLHDCFMDLKNGQINSANYFLLRSVQSELNRDDYLNDDVKNLRLIYYKKIIPSNSKSILSLIKKTKKLIICQSLLKQNGFFMKILSSYEIIVQDGLRERSNLINYSK